MNKYLALISFLILFASCYYDKEDELYPTPTTSGSSCDTSNVTYTTTIKPIFDSRCATSGCHSAQAKASGYDLSDYNGAKSGATGSRLLGSIMHQSGFSPMPKGMNKLTDCEISQVKAWVNAGTPQ